MSFLPGMMGLKPAGVPGGGGGGYSAEAQQFLDRLTDPGTTRKDAYAAIIDALVTAGVWSKLDALWIMAADSAGNGLVNLKSSSYPLTLVPGSGNPTFDADEGFTAENNSHYIDTGFNPSTAGGQFSQNSAHFSFWSRTASPSPNNVALMGNGAAGTSGESNLFPAYSGADFYGRVNVNSSSAFGTVPDASGHFIANRSSSTALQGYRNGAAVGSGVTATSQAPLSANFLICRATGGVSGDAKFAAASIGASLSSGEAAALYAALNGNKWW